MSVCLSTVSVVSAYERTIASLVCGSTNRKSGGLGVMNIPIISDPTRSITNDYGVLIKEDGIALRGLFVIDPEVRCLPCCASTQRAPATKAL